jgi:Caspase domain
VPGRYALIVANDVYEDEKLKQLRSPTRDAEELAQVLRDPDIGNFEVELSTNDPEHVLRRRIATFFADRRRDDLLLLHFSCHGLKDDSGQLFFAATDTVVAHLDATAVSSEFVSRRMTQSRSRKVITLLDCCYSGAIARGLQFRAGDQVDLDDQLGGHGRVIITASSAMEYAFEGGELSGSGNPSVFTTAVVNGLRTGEADLDQDHRISVDELYDYVCERVREVTPNQSPNMLSHLEGALYVARSSYVAPVDAAELPVELRAAIDSPLAGIREGAVTELARLADGPDRALEAAARESLAQLAQDDSRRVAAAAAGVLAGAERAADAEPALATAAPPEPPASPPKPAGTARAAGHAVRTPAEPRRAGDRWGTARRVAPPLLSVAGALTVMVSLLAVPADYWAPPEIAYAVAFFAAVAAIVVAALRVAGPLARGQAWPSALALVLAGIPLGVTLAAAAAEATYSEEMLADGPAALGALMMLAGASFGSPGRDPLPTAPRVMMLAGGVGLAVGLALPWEFEENLFSEPASALEFALVAVVAVALLVALAPWVVRRVDRARPSSRVLHAALPAVGAFAVAAVATILEILGARDSTAEAGAGVALLATAAIAVASLWPSRRS